LARIDELFRQLKERGGSDLHLLATRPPRGRVHGKLVDFEGTEPFSDEELQELLREITPAEQWQEYEETGDLDFAYSLPGVARFRVNFLRQHRGAAAVFRIIPEKILTFKELGIPQVVQELADLEQGLVLVTGPTGSGKTTTLYSALLQIQSPETKIITTEDPVEYQLDGISQIQVHTKIGLTFSHSLRSILRHDPDIVLVGEIRDKDTADNAIQASLTGHLVFSTLHTNDASSAFTRMSDMGVEPFLVAGTVEAVMAQRLLRRLCKHCREAYTPPKADVPDDFPFDRLGDNPFYRSVGCRECRNVGYTGRMGIYEMLVANDDIRQMALDRTSSWEIRKKAVEHGMRTLRMDAWDKVVSGDTSVDEVLRITKGEAL
jgi:pilus retraction protein PilT